MQRVRTFLVLKWDSALTTHRRLPASVRSNKDAVRCEGWHSSWDTAVGILSGNLGSPVLIVDDQGSLQIICVLNKSNLEGGQPQGGSTRWKSTSLHCNGESYWCNLNYSDYGWGWVSGAEREVPYRLRFFERRAEAHPDGFLARAQGWASEMRDWVYGPSKKIG